jgi:hypothetical protein
MRKTTLFFALAFMFFAFSCKKEPNEGPQQPTFQFENLIASNYQTKIGTLVTFSAITSGEIASYEWISKDKDNNNYGTFFGGGSQVEWSVCHADSFYITCTVAGSSSQKISKTIIMNVTDVQ